MTKPMFDPEKNLEDLLKFDSEESRQNPENIGEKQGPKIKHTELVFDIKPDELYDYLNTYVIGQEDAIEVIATKVCTHFNRMNIEKSVSEEDYPIGNIKSNILLIGPTGVGKTYIIKLIAKKIGVPFVKADATKFSETGYVGGDVEDLVRELVHEANGDITRAEYGIIYLDEIDKISSARGMNGPDVSRTGVQRNLLKLMEESEVDLKTPHDLASQVEAAMEAQRTGRVSRKKINTKNILFIVSGAFGGLQDIIKRRMNQHPIGFGKNDMAGTDKNDLLKLVRTEDLIEFGFESEFIGRLPVSVVLNDLNEDGLFKILKNKYSSVVLGKKLDFRAYGIDVEFTDEVLAMFASRAHSEKTGARGLLSVFEKSLIKFEKNLPSTSIKKLLVDRELVENPDIVLSRILLEDGIAAFQKQFMIEHGIFLNFDAESLELIKKISSEKRRRVAEICNDLFKNYFHGIRLMKLESFTITRKAVEDPENYLNDYIKTNYKG